LVAEVVVVAEDDTAITTVTVRKRLEHQVPRASILRKKVRPEKQRETTRDALKVSVADEAFMAEVGTEAVEADGPTPTPTTDDEGLHLAGQEEWVHST